MSIVDFFLNSGFLEYTNFIIFKSNSANINENIFHCAVIRIQGVSARSKLVKKQHSQQITGPPLSLYR